MLSNSSPEPKIGVAYKKMCIRLVRFCDSIGFDLTSINWFEITNRSQSQWIESIERQSNLHFLEFNHYLIDVLLTRPVEYR